MKNNQVRRLLCVLALVLFLSPLSVFAADDLMSAFKEGDVSGSIRIYHWQKNVDSTAEANATTGGDEDSSKSTLWGGIISYETAPLSGFTAGVGFRVQHELYAHDDFGEYYYFFPHGTDDHGIEAMSESYVRYNGFDTLVTLGRQYVDTPYMNPHDFRMLPKAYQGLSIVNNSIRNIEFSGGYFTHFLDWNSPEYEGMINRYLDDEGFETATDTKATRYVGTSYKPIRGMDANIWYYELEDVTRIITPQFKWFKVFNKDWKGFIDLRYTKWDSIGDELAGDVDTYMMGFIGGVIWKDWSLVLYGQQNGDDAPIEPFGHRRACTMQANWSHYAEEQAYLVKLGYDFGSLGVEGLSTYVRYGVFDTPDAGEENAEQDKTELEFNLTYKFQQKLKGLSLQLRYSIVDLDDDQRELSEYYYAQPFPSPFAPYYLRKNVYDYNDFRFYITYDF